ncbi:Olfactory receptor 13 [Tupaia chinensis]|uniref:Olfactory receptor 13 n=1 Tax=Tupaia chinensis TaxID=246437 RepID=L9LDT5_TUPCH|nr:Olfactory receptor 13 [Tupaia chinensis]
MLLFGLFSLFYVCTLLGNGVILGLILLDPRLHTPMYFFLSHLAFVDVAYACNTVPQMLVNLLNPAKPISYAGCMTQTFLFMTFAHTECLLLGPLCGHLPPPPIFRHHELESVHSPGGCCLDMWLSSGPAPHKPHLEVALLWTS